MVLVSCQFNWTDPLCQKKSQCWPKREDRNAHLGLEKKKQSYPILTAASSDLAVWSKHMPSKPLSVQLNPIWNNQICSSTVKFKEQWNKARTSRVHLSLETANGIWKKINSTAHKNVVHTVPSHYWESNILMSKIYVAIYYHPTTPNSYL